MGSRALTRTNPVEALAREIETMRRAAVISEQADWSAELLAVTRRDGLLGIAFDPAGEGLR